MNEVVKNKPKAAPRLSILKTQKLNLSTLSIESQNDPFEVIQIRQSNVSVN